jgi:hypothetical protein
LVLSDGDGFVKNLTEFLKSGTHLRLDGADGALTQFGDLFVGEFRVLAEKENVTLFGAQIGQSNAELFEFFAVQEEFGGGDARKWFGGNGLFKWSDFASPGVALQVLGCVQSDAKDPGFQVANAWKFAPRPPAFEKGFLSHILGVVVTAENQQKRTEEFFANFTEGAHEIERRSFPALTDSDRCHGHALTYATGGS